MRQRNVTGYDLTVGADPAQAMVIVRLAEVGGRQPSDFSLPPETAEQMALSLRRAAIHARALAGSFDPQLPPGSTFDVAMVQADSGTPHVLLRLDDSRRGFETTLRPAFADEVAGWLEAAAGSMRAQAAGEVDLTPLFPGQMSGKA